MEVTADTWDFKNICMKPYKRGPAFDCVPVLIKTRLGLIGQRSGRCNGAQVSSYNWYEWLKKEVEIDDNV